MHHTYLYILIFMSLNLQQIELDRIHLTYFMGYIYTGFTALLLLICKNTTFTTSDVFSISTNC